MSVGSVQVPKKEKATNEQESEKWQMMQAQNLMAQLTGHTLVAGKRVCGSEIHRADDKDKAKY